MTGMTDDNEAVIRRAVAGDPYCVMTLRKGRIADLLARLEAERARADAAEAREREAVNNIAKHMIAAFSLSAESQKALRAEIIRAAADPNSKPYFQP